MRKVAIVGAGTLPWRSRYADRTARALGFEAAKKALEDARLSKEDIDSTVYSIYCDTMLMQQHGSLVEQDYLGMGGKPSVRITGGAATCGYALYTSFVQVASGLSDVLLLLAVQKGMDFYSFATSSRGDGLLKGFAISFDTTWFSEIMAGVPSLHTVRHWLPHLQKYGSPTPEQVAKFSVLCHKNALANPEAELKINVNVEQVLDSRIISHPTTMLECCLYSDCAAALIIASEERARQICDKPVWITGIEVSNFPVARMQPGDVGRLMGVHVASQKAYQMAGIRKPADELDVIELHDLISSSGVIALEELGLCDLGEGGRLVDEGFVAMDGRVPVNPSGGRVACGHVAGVSAVYSAAQVTRQLQERAGGVQVPIRHGKGLMEAIDGYGGRTAVAVLERQS